MPRRLLEGEALLDAAIAQLDEQVLIVDSSGTIKYCNNALAEIVGLDVVEVIGRPAEALAATDLGRALVANLQRALAGERITEVVTLDRSDGRGADGSRTFSCAYRPVVDETTGRPVALLIVSDITQAQKAAAALQVSEGRYNALVQGAMDAIISVNDKGVIIQVNPASENLFGYTQAEMINQPLEMLLPPAERHIHRRLLQGFAKSPDSSRGMANFREVQGITKAGNALYLEVAISKYGGPNPSVMTAIVRDVTRRHQMEGHLRHFDKMRAIGQLAGGVAHDFNNVLAVVQSTVELALETAGADARMQRYLQRILAASRLAKDLTSKLLLFARDEQPQRQRVDLAEMFASLREMLERIFPANVVTSCVVEEGCWSVVTDGSQLQNALINLAINARDAMADGGRLTLSAANLSGHCYMDMNQAPQQGDMVEIRVTDTGAGMTEEVRQRAMEPFFTTKPRGEGNGLGLATVYGIVRRAEGVIALESTPGAGTTVRILLPRSQADEAARVARRARARAARTILLVEDNVPLRESQAEQLRNRGMTVYTAGSVEEAHAVFDRYPKIDLLLTDFRLADQSTGLDLAVVLRQRRPGLPVLIVTGYLEVAATTTLPEDITMLIKPVAIDDLLDHIAEAAGNSSAGTPAQG